MRVAIRFTLALGLVAAFAGLGTLPASGDDKPKFSIKEVMQMAHKDGLMKKVAGGKAPKEDKEKLVELYVSLSLDKPPKGDDKSWKDKTNDLVAAAKAALADDKDAGKVQKAANCKACHEVHKGK